MIGTYDNLHGKRIRIETGNVLDPRSVRVLDADTYEEITNVTRIEIDITLYNGRENKARLHLYVPATSAKQHGHTERVDVRTIECHVGARVEYADA